jgi:hypothetical protein
MPLPLLVKIDLEQWFKRDSASGIAEIFSIAEKLSTQLRVHPAAPMVTYVCNTKEVTPLVWKPTDRQRTFLIEWLVRKNLERLRESEKISLWRENPSPSDLTPNKNDQRSTEQLRLEAECLVWIQKIENLAKKKRQASTMSSERSDASSESENFSPLRFRSPFEKLEGRTIQIKWSEFPLFLAGNAERKTAINYWTTEGLPEILVDQTRWNQSPKTQRQLLIHELYGLAGVDDSDYVASEDISVRWNESLKPSEQNYLGYLLQLVGLPKDTKFPACSNIQEHY